MRALRSLQQLTLLQFRSMFRNKIAAFFNLLLPLIFLTVFGFMFRPAAPGAQTPVGLLDQDRGAVASTVRQVIGQSGIYEVVTGDEAELKEKLGQGKVRAILVLPEGLSGRVSAGAAPGEVTILYDPGSQSSGGAVAGLQALMGSADAAVRGSQPSIVVRTEGYSQEVTFQVFDFLMPGQLTYMLLSAGLVTVAISLATQRQSGALRHLLSTPVSIGLWLTARILANLLLAVVQIVILYTAAWYLFDVTVPADIAGTIVVLALSTLATLGFGLAVGIMVQGADTAMPVAMVLYMALSFLGNAMMPLDGAPEILHTLSKFMPSTYMTSAMRIVMMQGKGLGAAATELAVLGTCAVVLIGLAAWRMRKQFTVA